MGEYGRTYDKSAAGKRIRLQREQLGLSRSEAARRIGKAEKYYSDIERGYCGMSLETLVDIADCLRLTTDYIIFGETENGELPHEAEGLLLSLGGCGEKRRRKAIQLLELYLSDADGKL